MGNARMTDADVAKFAFGGRKTKKISMNLDQETLDFIDEIAELTKTTRTMVMLASLTNGLEPFLKNLETGWNTLLSAGNMDNAKKKRTMELIAKVQNLRRKLIPEHKVK
jgi:predicted transcriptional regulator